MRSAFRTAVLAALLCLMLTWNAAGTAAAAAAPAPVVPQWQNGDGEVILWWLTSPGPDIAHYLVLRRQEGTADWQELKTVPHDATAQYHNLYDPTVTNETLYHYRIIVVDQNGNQSPPAHEAAAHPSAAPPAVAWLEAETTDAGLTVAWAPVGEPQVTYVVERENGDGTATALTVTTAASANLPGAHPTRANWYFVTPRDEWGVFGPPTWVVAWPYRAVTVTRQGGEFSLTWAPLEGVESIIIKQAGSDQVLATLPGSASTGTITGLTDSAAPCFDLTAITRSTARAKIRACSEAQPPAGPGPEQPPPPAPPPDQTPPTRTEPPPQQPPRPEPPAPVTTPPPPPSATNSTYWYRVQISDSQGATAAITFNSTLLRWPGYWALGRSIGAAPQFALYLSLEASGLVLVRPSPAQ